MFLPADSEQKNKVRKISEISEFSYLVYGQIQKQGKLGEFFKASVMKEIHSLLVACLKLEKFFKASIKKRIHSVLVVCLLNNCFHGSFN